MPAESHLLAGFGLEPGVGKQELVLEIEIPEEAAVQSSQLLIKTMLNVFLMSIACRKNEKNSRPKFIPAGGLVADGVRSWRTHAASPTPCAAGSCPIICTLTLRNANLSFTIRILIFSFLLGRKFLKPHRSCTWVL